MHSPPLRIARVLTALFVGSLVVTVPVACVEASNAFDPDAPRAERAPGEIFGRVVLPGRDFDASPVILRVFDVVQGRETEVFDDGAPFDTRTSEQQKPAGIDDEEGAAGTFSIAPLPPGTYRVVFDAHENGEGLFADDSLFVTVGTGERVRRDVEPPRADIAAVGGVVEGSVEGAEAGKLFVVTLTPEGAGAGRPELVRTISRSESGPFAFASVPPGEYSVQVSGDAYVPNGSGSVEVVAGGRAVLPPLRLTVLGRLFTVVDFEDAQGQPPFRPYLPGATANVSVAPLALVSTTPPTPFVRLALADRFPTDPEEGWQPIGVGADAVPVDLDAALADGEREIVGQLRLCFASQCRCEDAEGECEGFRPPLVSGLTSLHVVVDRAPPEPVSVAVDGDGAAFGALLLGCSAFGEECPPLASAASYSALVEVRALDVVGRARGFAVTLDDSEPPGTFATVDALQSVADFVGDAPGIAPVDGEHTLRVWAQDRAGNVGLLDERVVLVDVTPPSLDDPALELGGVRALEDPVAPGVTLQVATDESVVVVVRSAGETAAAARVRALRGDARLAGAAVGALAPYTDGIPLTVTGAHRESVAFVVDVADAAGNVVVTQEVELVRWTRGSVRAAVEIEGQEDAAGARATLLGPDGVSVIGAVDAGQSTVIDPSGSEPFALTLDVDGALAIENAPAGSYRLRVEAPAPVLPLELPIEVRAAETGTLPSPLALSLARAELTGVFALEGREDTTGNAGIQVTLYRGDGHVLTTTSTLPDGSYRMSGVPAGEGYVVVGFFPDYVQAEVSGVLVRPGERNIVADDGSGAPAVVVLRALEGDFTLCAPTAGGELDESCAPLLYTNLEEVQVGGVDLTGFTQYRIATAPFAAADASPAFVDLELGSGGVPLAPRVTLGGAGEGRYTVYLQLASGADNESAVLEVDVVFDQTPPASPSLSLLRGAGALVDGYTRDSVVDALVTASPGLGAPLGDACARFAATPPGGTSGMTCGLHGTLLSLTLPNPSSEGRRTAYAFSCDRAGNCSAAPVSDAIVYDRTPPDVPASPGGASPTTGAGWGAALAASQHDGVRYHVNARAHELRVDAGTALEPDAAGADVPEVVAVRLALDAAALGSAPWAPSAPFLVPDGTMTLPTPSFVGAEGVDFEVRVQLADAAGNVTTPLGYALRLDATPPRLAVSLPSSTRDADGRVPVSVTDLDNEALVRARFAGDDGQVLEVSPTTPQVTLGGELVLAPAADASLVDGEYAVTVSASDRAGNTSLANRLVVVDREAPAAPAPASPAPGQIVTTTNPTYRWDAVTGAALFLLSVKQGANVVRGPIAVYTNEWLETVALPRGSYTWEVIAVDAVGNESGLGAGFPAPFVVDDAAPTGLAGLALAGAVTSTADTTPTLEWDAASDPGGQTPSASLRYTVEVYAGPTFDVLAFSATVVGGTGRVTLTPPSPLSEGLHAWRVTVTDLGGNAATVAGPTFLVDSQPPAAPQLAPLADPAGAPVVVRWSAPPDPDRAALRLQLSSDESFASLLLDSPQSDASENITASLVQGQRYAVRVASEDALGNRAYSSYLSFTFDGAPPALGASPLVVLDPGGAALGEGDLIVDRNVSVQLHAGVAGEVVRAFVSNEPGCTLPVAFELDTASLPNTVAWTLAPGGATKRVFARFVDEAGNATACVGSATFRSTGVVEGNVLVDAGATGLSLTGDEALGVVVRLSGGGLGAAQRFTTTDANGYYRFAGVPISPSGASNSIDVGKPELGLGATTVVAVADQTVTAPDVTLTVAAGSVSGAALLHANSPFGGGCSDPSNHSSVTLSLTGTAWNGEAVTRSTNATTGGTFAFTDVPGGVYQLTASRDGYGSLPARRSFQVNGGDALTSLDFHLYDEVAPEAPLVRLSTAAITAEPTATFQVDVAGSDETQPTSNFAGYRVVRIASGSGPTVVQDLGLLAHASSYDVQLVTNRTNRFLVVSEDCAGNESDPVEVRVVHDDVAPGAPTGVRVDNRDGAVRVSWDERPLLEGVVGYRVYYGGIDSEDPDDYTGEGASQGASPIDVGDESSVTLTGLTNQAQLYVAVQAVDAVESPGPNESPLSERATASPAAYPLDVAAGVAIAGGNDATLAGDRIVAVTSTTLRVYTYDTRGELSLRGSLAVGGDRVFGSPDHHFVYVTSKTDYAAGLKVVDVSRPTAPSLVQTFTSSPRRRYHLVAPGRYTNPAGTRREHIYAVYEEEGSGSYYIHSFRTSAAGSGALLDNGNRLLVPSAPTCLSGPFVTTSRDIPELRSAGPLAFLTIGDCLKVFKLSAFGTSFTQTDEVMRGTAHGIRGTSVDMPYLYAMDQETIRVHYVDASAGTLSDPRTPGSGDALAFSDAYGEFNVGSLAVPGALITSARGDLAVYDTSTISIANVPPASRTAPGLVGTGFLDGGGNFQSVKMEAFGGQLLHFRRESASGVVRIIEMGGPRVFERTADLGSIGRGRGGVVRGSTLARLGSPDVQLQLIDVRDPAAPGVLDEPGALENGGCTGVTQATCMMVERDASYAYVVGNSGDPAGGSVTTNHLAIFEVTDPGAASLVSVTDLGTGVFNGSGFPVSEEANALAVFDDVVAVGIDYPGATTPEGYVHFVDVRNRWAPTRVNLAAGFDTNAGDTRGVALDGKYAYVGKGSRLCVVRLFSGSTLAPTELGCQVLASDIRAVALRGTELLVSSGSTLRVFDVTDPTSLPLTELLSRSSSLAIIDLAVSGLSVYALSFGGSVVGFDMAFEESGRQGLAVPVRGTHIATSWPYAIDQAGFFTFLFNEDMTTRLLKQQ